MEVLNDFEKEAIVELNSCRKNPKEYAKHLQVRSARGELSLILPDLKKCFDGKKFTQEGRLPILTHEGVAAVEDAITALEAAKPAPPLTIVKGLCYAARDHANDIGPRGANEHTGEDGSSPFDRMGRYGKFSGAAGETIALGEKTGRAFVLQMLIDDGVGSRTHRNNCLNAEFHAAGVCVGPHKEAITVMVLDFAGTFVDAVGVFAKRPPPERTTYQAPPTDEMGRVVIAPEKQCAICRKELSGSILTAGDKKYHAACFVCQKCNAPIRGNFREVGQPPRPACPDCFAAHFAPKCGGCEKGVTEGAVKAMGKTFHKACFKCTFCKKLLDGPFAVQDDKPYCSPCANKHANEPKQ
eukprot:tig00021293_g20009.t1